MQRHLYSMTHDEVEGHHKVELLHVYSSVILLLYVYEYEYEYELFY